MSEPAFNVEDFTARMEEIASQPRDPEGQHLDADLLMAAALRALGYDAAMDAYESIGKWYS